MPEQSSAPKDHTLAVFIDHENLALGLKKRGGGGKLDIERVLDRLVEKGKIVVKRAYADWSRFGSDKDTFHAAGVELIEIPKRSAVGKNSADIRLAVDAMDLCHSKSHVDTFAIVSGDSDFSPLVSKLKENDKHVIGLGMKDSTSKLLSDNCDEFIYYEDLERGREIRSEIPKSISQKQREAFELLLDALLALQRENKEILYSSMVKETMKRKRPHFDESYHGYGTFSELLEDAEENGIVKLETDSRSGTYVVVEFGAKKKRPRRRRRSKTS